MGHLKGPGLPGSLKVKKVHSNPNVVGVEIGTDWLKIAQRDRVKNGQVVCRAKLLKLAQIPGSVSEAIADSFRLLKLNKQNVVAYIPRHLVTVRILELPAIDPKEISDMIDLQVGRQTPYAKEEIIFSHKIIEAGLSGYTKVMLAIVARNIVNERLEALVKAGLTVKKIAISSEGVCNWFLGSDRADRTWRSSQAVILVDVDSNYSDFIVIRNGKMVFTRNIFIGSNHLTQEGAGWQEKFSDELKRSVERYQGEEKNIEMVKAYLGGAGPNIKGLDVLLKKAVELSVENADQFMSSHSQMVVEGLLEEDSKFVSMTQLLGATLDDEPYMDLIPNEQKVQNAMERKTKQLTIMGILIVAIVTALSFLCLTRISAKVAYLEELKNTMSKIAVEAESIDEMRAVIDLVEQRLDSRGSSLEIINEIYKITPKEIYLTDINIDEKKSVVLRGSGYAMSDVFKYVKILEESAMFENVKTTYTRSKNNKNSEFAEFEINCVYEKNDGTLK